MFYFVLINTMSIPFLIDVSAFYGEPDPYEQSSGVILDKNKTLSLHRKIDNAGVSSANSAARSAANGAPKKRKGKKSAGAISMKQNTAGAIGFKESGGAIGFKEAGALAFNEAQLMNELTGLKKGGALPALAATVIPTLIEMAPQIIAAIKSLRKNPSGGAIKIGGASAVFLDGVDPSKYDDMIKTMKAIERQRKNLIREGGAIKVGSGKMGTFFKNAWNNIKSWYGNNADKLNPITDILVNSAVNSANKMIDKGVKYVGDKTGSDTLKQISNVVGNMAKNTVSNTAAAVQNYGKTGVTSGNSTAHSAAEGSGYSAALAGGYSAALAGGYDIDNLVNDTTPAVVATKKKKILTAMPNNERKVTASQVRAKKSRSVYG